MTYTSLNHEKPRRRIFTPGRVGFVLFVIFAALQFKDPIWQYKMNPPVTSEAPWNNAQTKVLAQRACYDCHSNETRWPIYGWVAPFSWLVMSDVQKGRGSLNFSAIEVQPTSTTAETSKKKKENMGDATTTELEKGSMPPQYYLWAHPNARLTEAEKQQLIKGLQETLKDVPYE